MNNQHIDLLGAELYDALRNGRVVEPLKSRHPDMTIEDAYRIQQSLNARRIEAETLTERGWLYGWGESALPC
ncbi:hypothetical protein SAMN05414139_10120 [Burkholderia sp. D7]|nr:hypothetical protein SAMN05414139_10120 [Burkholderia sp. D7]